MFSDSDDVPTLDERFAEYASMRLAERAAAQKQAAGAPDAAAAQDEARRTRARFHHLG